MTPKRGRSTKRLRTLPCEHLRQRGTTYAMIGKGRSYGPLKGGGPSEKVIRVNRRLGSKQNEALY